MATLNKFSTTRSSPAAVALLTGGTIGGQDETTSRFDVRVFGNSIPKRAASSWSSGGGIEEGISPQRPNAVRTQSHTSPMEPAHAVPAHDKMNGVDATKTEQCHTATVYDIVDKKMLLSTTLRSNATTLSPAKQTQEANQKQPVKMTTSFVLRPSDEVSSDKNHLPPSQRRLPPKDISVPSNSLSQQEQDQLSLQDQPTKFVYYIHGFGGHVSTSTVKCAQSKAALSSLKCDMDSNEGQTFNHQESCGQNQADSQSAAKGQAGIQGCDKQGDSSVSYFYTNRGPIKPISGKRQSFKITRFGLSSSAMYQKDDESIKQVAAQPLSNEVPKHSPATGDAAGIQKSSVTRATASAADQGCKGQGHQTKKLPPPSSALGVKSPSKGLVPILPRSVTSEHTSNRATASTSCDQKMVGRSIPAQLSGSMSAESSQYELNNKTLLSTANNSVPQAALSGKSDGNTDAIAPKTNVLMTKDQVMPLMYANMMKAREAHRILASKRKEDHKIESPKKHKKRKEEEETCKNKTKISTVESVSCTDTKHTVTPPMVPSSLNPRNFHSGRSLLLPRSIIGKQNAELNASSTKRQPTLYLHSLSSATTSRLKNSGNDSLQVKNGEVGDPVAASHRVTQTLASVDKSSCLASSSLSTLQATPQGKFYSKKALLCPLSSTAMSSRLLLGTDTASKPEPKDPSNIALRQVPSVTNHNQPFVSWLNNLLKQQGTSNGCSKRSDQETPGPEKEEEGNKDENQVCAMSPWAPVYVQPLSSGTNTKLNNHSVTSQTATNAGSKKVPLTPIPNSASSLNSPGAAIAQTTPQQMYAQFREEGWSSSGCGKSIAQGLSTPDSTASRREANVHLTIFTPRVEEKENPLKKSKDITAVSKSIGTPMKMFCKFQAESFSPPESSCQGLKNVEEVMMLRSPGLASLADAALMLEAKKTSSNSFHSGCTESHSQISLLSRKLKRSDAAEKIEDSQSKLAISQCSQKTRGNEIKADVQHQASIPLPFFPSTVAPQSLLTVPKSAPQIIRRNSGKMTPKAQSIPTQYVCRPPVMRVTPVSDTNLQRFSTSLKHEGTETDVIDVSPSRLALPPMPSIFKNSSDQEKTGEDASQNDTGRIRIGNLDSLSFPSLA